jgi:hypothetical protein
MKAPLSEIARKALADERADERLIDLSRKKEEGEVEVNGQVYLLRSARTSPLPDEHPDRP